MRKKHSYEDRLKYMKMLEAGYSMNYIHEQYGIGDGLLKSLWIKYQQEGPSSSSGSLHGWPIAHPSL